MKIKVLSKKHIKSDGKGEFYTYFTPVNIQCFDEDGTDLGIQTRKINVHFTKKASKKLEDDKVFAIIDGDIQLPFVWKVKENEDGEKEYPECWVREINSVQPIPFKARENTCVPILDEEETEPVEIIEE